MLQVHRPTHSYVSPKANKLPDTFTLKSGTRQRCVSISTRSSSKVLATVGQGGSKTEHVRIERGTWE